MRPCTWIIDTVSNFGNKINFSLFLLCWSCTVQGFIGLFWNGLEWENKMVVIFFSYSYDSDTDRNHTIIHFSVLTTYNIPCDMVFRAYEFVCVCEKVIENCTHCFCSLCTIWWNACYWLAVRTVFALYTCVNKAHNPKTNCSNTLTHSSNKQPVAVIVAKKQPFGKQIYSCSFSFDLIRFFYMQVFFLFRIQNRWIKRTHRNKCDWFIGNRIGIGKALFCAYVPMMEPECEFD